jgi:outer membrane protein OmpA-like peptidoglycan-associated protein
MKRSILVLCIAFLMLSGCSQGMNSTATGAATGGAMGAGLGAIIGDQSGHAGPGTAIGAAAGVITGALVGSMIDEQDKQNQQMHDRLDLQEGQIAENKRLIEELRRRGADAWASDRGVVINLPDILFEFDSANLTREADRTLDEIGDVLRTVKHRMLAVEGHTDSIGTVSYNKRLSTRRATSVARSLERRGIASEQMVVRGYGEGAPIATNNSEAGRARNRRVEVIVEN